MRELQALVPRLAGHRILVIGDIVLDEYVIGRATRMSREAPIPVLEFEARRLIAGGAANPAANITALGSQALQVSVIGDDTYGEQLREVLQTNGIACEGLVTDSARPTTMKTRIMAQMGLRFPQQVARLDRLSREPLSAAVEHDVIACIEHHLPAVDAVLLSDYRAGLLTQTIVNCLRSFGDKCLLTVDAQGELNKYSGFNVVKCNADEARTHLRRDLRTDSEFAAAAQQLRETLALRGAMVITRGADGATLATADGSVQHCPAPAVTDVFDTVGAGDTAIAMITLGLVAGASYHDATMLANYASGLVVRRVGNYAPTPQELIQAIGED